jgi:hypothetical protein
MVATKTPTQTEESTTEPMAATETPTQTEESTTDRILSELLTSKMAEALSKAQAPTVTSEPAALLIGIKLDGSNYGLWS